METTAPFPQDSSSETHARARRASVSLVIPVRNEAKTLPALLDSIRAQTLPPSEVIIVDGGSSDATVQLATRLTEGSEIFRVIEAGEATPGRGRNVGSAAASCEWVAYTDAGIQLKQTWLERLVTEAERDPSLDVVYGNYEPAANSLFERCAALTYVPPKQARGGGLMRGPSIASALVRRHVWQRTGGFPDLRAAEDLMFMENVERAGFKIGWAPEATVWWQLQPTLLRTFRKFVLYSRHNVWAGRARYWHYGIARQYLIALPFLILAVIHTPLWLIAPLLGGALRALKSIWLRRENRGMLWVLNPVQLLYVLIIVLTIDAATFIGWAQALRQPSPARQ